MKRLWDLKGSDLKGSDLQDRMMYTYTALDLVVFFFHIFRCGFFSHPLCNFCYISQAFIIL